MPFGPGTLIKRKEIDKLLKKDKIILNGKDIVLDDDDIDVLVEVIKNSEVLDDFSLFNMSNITLMDGKLANAIGLNRSLRVLWLTYNQIGIEGAKFLADALKVNCTIKVIHLEHNQLGDEGARHLSGALPHESIQLRGLYLNHNQIGNSGARSLAESFKVNKSLEKVALEDNEIDIEGGLSLAAGLKSNHSIRELREAGNHLKRGYFQDILRDVSRYKVPDARNGNSGKLRGQGVNPKRKSASQQSGKRKQAKKQARAKPTGTAQPNDTPQTEERDSKRTKKISAAQASNSDDDAGASVKQEDRYVENEVPDFVDYEDIVEFYRTIEGKSDTSDEEEFYGHLMKYIDEKGPELLTTNFNKMKTLTVKFQIMLRDQAQSKTSSFRYEKWIMGIVKECKKEFHVA